MDEKKVFDSSWDFREDDTKISNHGFHSYPSMMIPQVARRLIDNYGRKASVLCDPFMGTGTSVLEAKLHENFTTAYGIDINPLARLVAKVKTTPIEYEILSRETINVIEKSEEEIANANIFRTKVDVPNFSNIDFWFKPKAIRDLAIIRNNINSINTDDPTICESIKNFLLVSFSETVRLASNTRNSEFKLYRMAPEKLKAYTPQTIKIFREKTCANLEKMRLFNSEAKRCKVNILDEDTRHKTSIPSECVDIVVTSPPYGDSHTTVAYGQFSRLSLEWLGFDSKQVRNIDKISLGGIPTRDLCNSLSSPSLSQVLQNIADIDPIRARSVLSFYLDFSQCVIEIDRFMKIGGYLCFVVGNRTVKKQQIPTDDIIKELFQAQSQYEHIKTIIRSIPNKRMPKANSPTNVKGELSSTMNNEYIVILQKM